MLSVFYPYRGGIAQFSGRLFRELEKEHEIKAFNFSRQYPSFLFPGKTQFVQQNDASGSMVTERSLDAVNPLSWYRTASLIQKWQPELFISRLWMPFFGPAFGTVASFLKKKCIRIAILDNVIPHERHAGDLLLTKYFLNRHDGFLVMSSQVAEDLRKLKSDAQFRSSPHPLYDHFGSKVSRDEACRKLNIDPDKKILLYYGFVRKYKGLDLLLEAFSKLDNSYQLIIAGEWYEDSKSSEEKISHLGLSDRIIFLNRYIGMEETTLLFSAADACTLSYLQATQSGVAAIAMYYEVPLIVTRVGGLYEQVEQYKTGLICSELNPASFAKTIENLFAPKDPIALKENFRKLKNDLSWPRFKGELLSLYNSLKR